MVAGRLQEKNGFYYIVLSYTDSAGKRRQPWIGTGLPVKGNKKRAEKMLAETRKDFTIPKGQVSELSPDMAFSDYMRYWLKMMRTAVTETTYSSYCFNVEKHIIPYFEPLGVTLAGLQPRQIQSFYLHEAETLKNTTGMLDSLFGYKFPYMMCLYNEPVNGPDTSDFFHFHIAFYPPMRSADKIKYNASSETGAWAHCNPTCPEETAEELRAAYQRFLKK